MSQRAMDLSRVRLTALSLAVTVLAIAAIAPAAGAANAKTKRASIGTGGTEAIGFSQFPSISAGGRYVAFSSTAANLVVNDTNGRVDVFVRDRKAKKTRRVSVRTGGAEANESSDEPSISANGRYVAFTSIASNLVHNDTNGASDVFVRDRKAKKTRRVSVRSGGAEANESSIGASISANGRYVVFSSHATNLVAGDANGERDVFIHDRKSRKTRRVSVRSGGAEGNSGSFAPSVSADGRYVAFISEATNLVRVDTNGRRDVFVRDRLKKKTRRMSVRSSGAEGNGFSDQGTISADGRYVVFRSDATDLVNHDTNSKWDILVRDRLRKKTRRVSIKTGGAQANGLSSDPWISADGRYVVFWSSADNLVSGDTNGKGDIFLRDRATKKTRRISVRTGGAQANDGSEQPTISANGRYVAFRSAASDLVTSDLNGRDDIFVRGPLR